MILGQVSWLDCFVFLVFLAPQLILRVGFLPTLFCGLRALPFLLIKLPLSFIYERFFLARHHQTPFVQKASWFEDIVIRCVRYAFANIPASIGRVFFSKPVALPFLRFRMLRHGYLRSPLHWHEVKEQNFIGLWIIANPTIKPDLIIYYLHGGGFSMGSSYFYLEFLITLLSLISSTSTFTNPAILALEYTLVPDAAYPVQLQEAIAGYAYALRVMRGQASRVCVAGDSAGGTIVLSMLLRLAEIAKNGDADGDSDFNARGEISGRGGQDLRPGMAVLISPWVTLDPPTPHTHTHVPTSDYLSPSRLQHYARQYSGPCSNSPSSDELISPGTCTDPSTWRAASPLAGFFTTYGSEEVLAPDIRAWTQMLSAGGVGVRTEVEGGGVHAWPVAGLFLGGGEEERVRGVRGVGGWIVEGMGMGIGMVEKGKEKDGEGWVSE